VLSKYLRCSDYRLRKKCGKGRGRGCFEVISRRLRTISTSEDGLLLTGFELCTHTKLTTSEGVAYGKTHKAKRHKIEFEYRFILSEYFSLK
jgi:hypothetical protein